MKVSNTSMRLKQLMEARRMKQVDILEKVEPFAKKYDMQLKKNDLSQYVSGKVEPSQFKLSILSMALGVSEVWLMGYDVPEQEFSDSIIVTEIEKRIIEAYRNHPEMQTAVGAILIKNILNYF